MALKLHPPRDLQTPEHETAIGKAAELLVLGLLVGAFSIVLSFLWTGYAHKASDLIQYFAAESGLRGDNVRLPVRLVFMDIGERTCREWAKSDYDELCAGLPRFPHAELAKIFRRLAEAKPKLVVVDIDLRTEKPRSNPFDPDVGSFTDDELDIRKSILAMQDTAFLVAQPLIRQPMEDQPQYYDYRLVGTILHRLKKDNLRFGQVEQDLGDDGVMRRFPATVPLTHPDAVLNPNTTDGKVVEHLALRACELVKDSGFCGRDSAAGAATSEFKFGSLAVQPGDFVQFPFLLPRDLTRLADEGVDVIEARSILAPSFDMSMLEGSVMIFGSTARGRGDYHVTPLDVRGGETAGVVVLANEVVAALADRWLVAPSWATIVMEKLVLIALSTAVIFFGFWYFHLGPPKDDGIVKGWWAKKLSTLLLSGHFLLIVAVAIGINALIMWFVSVHAFRTGELIDPVTPVVAAILDIVVDICAIIKARAAYWANQWWAGPAKSH